MARLPLEIFQGIINELARSTVQATDATIDESLRIGIECNAETTQLSRYASVSREWQSLVEAHTFHALSFTSKELHQVRAIISKRWRLVRTVRFEILLPEYDFEARKRKETFEEQQKNSEVFTDAIESLFNETGQWVLQDDAKYANMERLLSIGCHSPSDFEWNDRMTYQRRSRNPEDIRTRRHAKSYIEFLNQERPSLKSTRAFTKLECPRHRRRIMDASSFCTLASYMPRLTLFSGDMWDNEIETARRSELRLEFACNLPKLPQSVRHVWISYHHKVPDSQKPPPNLSPSHLDYDPFSTGIRHFSQQLVTLSLSHCVIGMDLFWPAPSDQHQTLPHWPNLQKVFMLLHPFLSDGSQLFKRNPLHPEDSTTSSDTSDDNDTPSDNPTHWPTLRSRHHKPAPQTLDHFHLNIALAAENMPKLNRIEIRFMEYGFDPPKHTFKYEENGTGKHIAWKSRPWYHPSAEIVDTWQRAKGYDMEIESDALH